MKTKHKVHFINKNLQQSLCGVEYFGFTSSETTDLEKVTCKNCLKVSLGRLLVFATE